jgi:hypothetical protein
MWNEVVIAKFKKLSVHLPRSTGEFYEKSGWKTSGPLFETEIVRIGRGSTSHSTAILYILRNKNYGFCHP